MKTATLNGMTNGQLFDALMRRLSARFTHIPSTGIIAGQAVASACYDILNIASDAPMRDLDVFMSDEQLPKSRIADFDETVKHTDENGHVIVYESTKAKLARQFGTPDCSLETVSHGAINLFDDRDGITSGTYTINGSYIDREHRETNYIHVIHTTRKNRAMNIINGFDINACQIGMDMESETVVWTDAFAQFLNDHVLRVTFFGTPMHSAVRLCKKREDLGFTTVDLDTELRALATMRHFIEIVERKRTVSAGLSVSETIGLPGQLFSNIYAGRFKQYETVLSPYFELTPRNVTVNRHYTIQKNDNTQEAIEKEVSLSFFVLTPKQHNADDAIYDVLHHLLQGSGYSELQNLEFVIQTFGTIEKAKHNALAHSRLKTLGHYLPAAISSLQQGVLFAELLRNLDQHYFPSADEFKKACQGHQEDNQLSAYQLGHESLKIKIWVGINLAQQFEHNLYTISRSGFEQLLDSSPETISLKRRPSIYLERAKQSHEASVKQLRALRRTPQIKNVLHDLSESLGVCFEEIVCPNRLLEEHCKISDYCYLRVDFEKSLFVKLVSGDTHALYCIDSNVSKKRLSVTLIESTDNRIPPSYGEALDLAVNLHWTILNCEYSAPPANDDLTELALKLKRLRDGHPRSEQPVFEDDIPF